MISLCLTYGESKAYLSDGEKDTVSLCYSDLKAPSVSESREVQSESGFLVCSSHVCGHGFQQGSGVSKNFERCLTRGWPRRLVKADTGGMVTVSMGEQGSR